MNEGTASALRLTHAWAICCVLMRLVRVAEERGEQRNNTSVWIPISEEPGAEQLALKTGVVSPAQMLFAHHPTREPPY